MPGEPHARPMMGDGQGYDIQALLQSYDKDRQRTQEAAQEGEACTTCWGAMLTRGRTCTPGFQMGKFHFKNKFCDACKSEILVSLTQVRALSEAQMELASNKKSEGFWNVAPASMGGGLHRIVNNTNTCPRPWLVIFRDAPPSRRMGEDDRSRRSPPRRPEAPVGLILLCSLCRSALYAPC